MKRVIVVVSVVILGGAVLASAGTLGWFLHKYFGDEAVSASAPARSPAEERVLATLKSMREAKEIEFGVPEADGRRLRLIVESMGAMNVVELGTSTGYSALWMSLGVLPTNGHVTTFEINPRRAGIAQERFRRAGVADRVTVVLGDAHKTIASLKEPIDIIFMDADKEGYTDYLDKLLPLLRPGGLIMAHNIAMAPDYFARVTSSPDLETVVLTQGSGLSATMKKR